MKQHSLHNKSGNVYIEDLPLSFLTEKLTCISKFLCQTSCAFISSQTTYDANPKPRVLMLGHTQYICQSSNHTFSESKQKPTSQ